MEKTKREYYNEIRSILEEKEETDLVAFVDHELELLTKKNAARSDKPTKVQVENAGYMQDILYGLEPGKSYTITEIQKTVEAVKELSNQRVSRLARNLVDSGGLVRTEVKGKAYFTLAQ